MRTDFVAGWHIHDIEERDTWIARVASLLHLEYYDMDIDELRERLKAKGAEEATPQLDFDGNDEDADMAPDPASIIPLLPEPMEGEMWVSRQQQPVAVSADGGGEEPAGKFLGMSLDDAQLATRLKDWKNEDEGDDAASDNSISSGELSQQTDSTDVEFDAQEILIDVEELAAYEEDLKRSTELASHAFVVNSDQSLAQLMGRPVEEIILASTATNKGPMLANQRVEPRKKTRVEALRNKNGLKDGRFKTDVFTVRQSMREAYRNVPHDDFAKFINFVQRGLKFIRHYNPAERITYWHTEDPTFKMTVCSNMYTEQLLLQMGFVCVNGTYWVWPEKHLNYRHDKGVWGSRIVPPDCPGSDKMRLDDMLTLFKLYQRILLRDGRKFTGHLGK
jgi:hypothetical protein